MKKHPGDRLPILSVVVVVVVITLIHVPKSLCQNQNRDYETCGQAFRCGNIDFTYPFWGGPDRPEYCGYPGFRVSCQSNTVPTIAISQAQTRYRILQPPDATAHTIRVARNDLFANNCPTGAVDTTTVNFTIFTYSNIQNLTLLYGCPSVPPPLPRPLTEFVCSANAPGIYNYYFVQNSELGSIQNLGALASCSRNITVPIDQGTPSQSLVGSGGLTGALSTGFTLGYEANNEACQTCSRSSGRCGYNHISNSFVCYCSDRAYDRECNGTSSSGNGMHVH